MKKILFSAHKYVGLVTGILMFFTSISGALYVFHDELFQLIHRNTLYTQVYNEPTKSLDQLLEKAQKHIGGDLPINSITTYSDLSRTWEFKSYHTNPNAIHYFDWIKQNKVVYINPHTGDISGTINLKYEFFQLIKMFHWSYLLKTEYGQPIVGIVTLLFLICLLTGVWIWWPKNGIKRKHFRFRTKKGFRIINRDVHLTLGILTFPFAFIICITGLIWAYRWMMVLIYLIFNLGVNNYSTSTTKSKDAFPTKNIYQKIYNQCHQKYPDAYSISLSKRSQKKEATINAFVKLTKPVYYKSVRIKFDQYTGQQLEVDSFDESSNGEKAIKMNYDIHTGAIGGIIGKIIMFIISMILSALPISGYIIWLNRHK